MFDHRNEEWRRCYDRGVRLWNELQEALKHLRDQRLIDFRRGWRISGGTSFEFLQQCSEECQNDGILGLVDRLENQDPLPPGTKRICSNPYDYYNMFTHQGIPESMTNDFSFTNWYSAGSKAIIAKANVARIDPNTYDPPVFRPKDPVPPHAWLRSPYNWAAVVFAAWSNACSREGVFPCTLRFIGRMYTSNPATLEAVQDIWEDEDDDDEEEQEEDHEGEDEADEKAFDRTYTYTDADFYALIGTPNGVGVAQLLSSYPNAFALRGNPHNANQITKVKTIGKVVLLYRPPGERGDSCDLVFILDDVEPPLGFDAPQTPAVPPVDQGLP